MTTYSERTARQLEQARRHNPQLRAMISLDEAGAMGAAQQADAAQERGEWLGLLHGMTVSVKDNIDIAGQASSAGASFLADNIATADAPVVERLRKAGATIVGRANMAELAFGSRSLSTVGGQCRNPWNPERIPGGSSGGSAVSVAAGMCTGSLGTDTGGSVRLPASLNGVAGLRPTHGRIPIRGVVPVSEHNDSVGPLARRVTDVARLFAVLAGYDAADPTTVDLPVPHVLTTLNDGIAGRRIGIPRQHYFEQLEAGVGEAVMAAAHHLERAGAVLVDVDLPLAGEAHIHQTHAVFADVCHVFHQQLTHNPQAINAATYERMRNGLDFTAVQYAEAMAFRNRWRLQLRGVFAQVDMLLSPTTPAGAPLIEDGNNLLEATRAVTRNTYAGALAGIPGLSVPCGFTGLGMPIGVQLEAAQWQEPMLLQAGVELQRGTDFHLQQAAMLG
ncbi:amidase [Pseudorhodoferax sp. Leaf267]|uniref:amidase n=1 Tax=Pseudorhodoferax sp. Leaf267 TaxID=1736316 RepID=UPI0006FD21BB|nr:amidase [Pseudorhodoferax sp. Leaf267]KQP14221.1 hypothetical protein ASF43_15470 [Pseudorhodoferax sp. Leaf267]